MINASAEQKASISISTLKCFFGLKTTDQAESKEIYFFLEYRSIKKAIMAGTNKTIEITAPI